MQDIGKAAAGTFVHNVYLENIPSHSEANVNVCQKNMFLWFSSEVFSGSFSFRFSLDVCVLMVHYRLFLSVELNSTVSLVEFSHDWLEMGGKENEKKRLSFLVP